MKNQFTIVLCLISFFASGQTQNLTEQLAKLIGTMPNNNKISGSNNKQVSAFEINYIHTAGDDGQPICFVNSKPVPNNYLNFVDRNSIKKFSISKEEITVNGHVYKGQVHVTLKDSVKVEWLSFSEINKMYLKSSSNDCIYMIDDKLIHDPDTYAVQKDYILKLTVEQAELWGMNSKPAQKIDVIRVYLKTKANLDKQNEFFIR